MPWEKGKINARQQKFIDAYLTSRSGAEAARIAGYSPSKAGECAARLLKVPQIKAAIEQKKKSLQQVLTNIFLSMNAGSYGLR